MRGRRRAPEAPRTDDGLHGAALRGGPFAFGRGSRAPGALSGGLQVVVFSSIGQASLESRPRGMKSRSGAL
jgi:hypothetical protein